MIEGEKGIGSFLRRKKMNRPWMWMLALLLWGSVSVAEKNPNILFISIDDLRPELGCYGNQKIQSPHIDALASEGTVFEEASFT